MAWSSRGRPSNAPASFINLCQPTVTSRPPSGRDWVHELKHDGYRLQVHVRDGRVRLYTMNGADWPKRYPLIIEGAARIEGSAIFDAEADWLDSDLVADFEALHSRANGERASACAFDLLMFNDDDLRRRPCFARSCVGRANGIQYVGHVAGVWAGLFEAVCKLGLEGLS